MKILITHEESQVVTTAFLRTGNDAYSCDLLQTSGDFHGHRGSDGDAVG